MESLDIVEVNNLVFEYPKLRALNNVSFRIKQGSITALVGPNGAGKTTLLRCIAGLEFPLSGQIIVNGQPVLKDPRTIHRHIGYLSDNFGLSNSLTVSQCLMYAAWSQKLKVANIKDTIQATAEKLQIADRLPQLVGTLSRGLRQRVAIAQAIIHNPKLLLLDEPASGLDPDARHSLSELLCWLKEEGMTLLVSSHILSELKEYSTDMLVLKQGCLIQHSATGGSSNTSLVFLEIKLAQASSAIKAILEKIAGVYKVEAEGFFVRLSLDEQLTSRHHLLSQLVNSGIAVISFSEANDMQQSYLSAVRDNSNRR
jgi:ABC-2 type transport system ATP-binding protein